MAIISEVVKSESYSPACNAAYGVHVFLKEAKLMPILNDKTRVNESPKAKMCLDQKDTIRKF